MTLHMVNRGF